MKQTLRIWFATLILAFSAIQGLAQGSSVDGTPVTTRVLLNGLDQPVFVTSPPGEKRLFIVQQTGKIRIFREGQLVSKPFLNHETRISTGGERGLLGMAFHPNYAANGRLFVYFTNPDGDIQISEFSVSNDPDRANANSERILLTIPHRDAANHNGGWLGFGPDGFLYIATGDGGSAGDPMNNGQDKRQLLGKILRINVDGGSPYGIPPKNPFATRGGAPEIFALGLRNPWRASFDGERLYIGDVGQDKWEEISVIRTNDAGINLGWRLMEGPECFKPKTCDQTGLTLPVYSYDHGTGCSVTGGYVYRGKAMPALDGRYFFSDFCSGQLMSFRLRNGAARDFANLSDDLGSLGQISSFGQDGVGEIFILTLSGELRKIVPVRP